LEEPLFIGMARVAAREERGAVPRKKTRNHHLYLLRRTALQNGCDGDVSGAPADNENPTVF